jgi:hypothetical protein
MEAAAQEGRLSEIERDASYCYGVASERYGNYLFSCKGPNDETCKYAKELKMAAAARAPITAYLEKQGLALNGSRSAEDKNEHGKLVGRGTTDWKACFEYFDKTLQGCLLYCVDHEKQGNCLTSCREQRDSAPCDRIQICNDPFSPVPLR